MFYLILLLQVLVWEVALAWVYFLARQDGLVLFLEYPLEYVAYHKYPHVYRALFLDGPI